jgi:3-oxoacyl-[acyl-carrier protein] reductase
MELGLKGKAALVTGGSRGIGAAIARALGAEGVRVGVGYATSAALAEEVAAGIRRAHGVEAVALPGDLASDAAIVAMFDALERRWGGVDLLVNNAAYCPKGPIESYPTDAWERTFRINVTAAFVASQEHVRRLRAAGRKGAIVNIASQAAFLGSTSGHLPYDASKGALVSMTRAIAREVAKDGIRVNAVAPGMVRTEMVAALLDQKLDFYLSRIPLNRIAEPDDVARAVVFLASDAASYMTGATLDLTGGQLMR